MGVWKTQLGRLRIVAFLEGISFFVLLLITMPLKYQYHIPEPNQVMGMLHGLLFILYVLAVLEYRLSGKWSNLKTMWALLAAVLPFGTFWADYRLFRNV